MTIRDPDLSTEWKISYNITLSFCIHDDCVRDASVKNMRQAKYAAVDGVGRLYLHMDIELVRTADFAFDASM